MSINNVSMNFIINYKFLFLEIKDRNMIFCKEKAYKVAL